MTTEHKTDLDYIDDYRKGLIKDKFCSHRYEMFYGEKCNNYCKFCPFNGFETILKNTKESNEIVLIKLLQDEQKEISTFFGLEIVLRLLGKKTIDDLDGDVLVALYDYYLGCANLIAELTTKDDDYCDCYDDFWSKTYDALDIIRSDMISRTGVTYDIDDKETYLHALDQAIEILKNK